MLDPAIIEPEALRPLKRVEFEQLADLGFFEDERVELLFGVVVRMTPPKPPHASCVDRVMYLFMRALGDRAYVRVQGPYAASEDSEPQPDVSVFPPGDYRTEHPTEAWLLVEVAESSLRKDRKVKARLYAECAVEEYWIVDVVGKTLERFTAPIAGIYTTRETFRTGDAISPLRFPDVRFELAEIL